MVMIRLPSTASPMRDPPLARVIRMRNESGERTVLMRMTG